jgi:hypothetical protein
VYNKIEFCIIINEIEIPFIESDTEKKIKMKSRLLWIDDENFPTPFGMANDKIEDTSMDGGIFNECLNYISI